MSDNKSHLIFDKDTILISQDLIEIFDFLMEIEKEVKVVVEIEKRLEEIKKHSLSFFDLIIYLWGKLEENNIDYEYSMENPNNYAENFKIDFPVRSQMLVIFSFLETVFNLFLAYTYKTSDQLELLNLAMDKGTKNKKLFIDTYLLNTKNTYFNQNNRLNHINSKSLILLRNSLSHFFSTASKWIQVNHSSYANETRKLEEIFKKQLNQHTVFLSPEELYWLMNEWIILLLREWSNHFLNDPIEFNSKIKFVRRIVEEFWAKIIYRNQIKL